MVYRKLPDKISNPGPLLGVMRNCREAMLAASSQVKPMGTTYHGLCMVVTAIDALATLLVGRPNYFWAQGTARPEDATLARAEAERAAEAGRAPWPGES